MTRTLLFVCVENGAYRRHAQALADSYGCELVIKNMNETIWRNRSAACLRAASFLLCWNGWHGYTPHYRRAADACGIPWATMEWGWLPQKDTFQCQPGLGCGDSILSKDLSWVNKQDLDRLREKRSELQATYPLRPKGYVLVPLQILADTTMLLYTDVSSHMDFVERVQGMYPDREVVVRPHPRGGKTPPLPKGITLAQDGTWMDWAAEASVVVGATSTTLVESGVLGVPTVALGNCPLKRWSSAETRERCLAGHLALQYPRKEPEGMVNILARFNMRPKS